MLILGVLLMVLIDLIIIFVYTAVVGAQGELSATRVVHSENPRDEIGVRYLTYLKDIFVTLPHRTIPHKLNQV